MKRLAMIISLGLLIFTLSACNNDNDDDYTVTQSEEIFYNLGDVTPDYETYFGMTTNNKGAFIDSFDDSLVDYTKIGEYDLNIIIDVAGTLETEVFTVKVIDNESPTISLSKTEFIIGTTIEELNSLIIMADNSGTAELYYCGLPL